MGQGWYMKSMPYYGFIIGVLLLSGCSRPIANNSCAARPSVAAPHEENDLRSTIKHRSAERMGRYPDEMVSIDYSGPYQTGFDQQYNIHQGDLEYTVRDANYNFLPITRSYNHDTGEWQYAIEAYNGTQYQLYVRNYSRSMDYEIVATVDGLDVLSGKAASLNNSGYIVPAGGSLAIKGFRKNSRVETAFEFSNVSASYAVQSAQEIGRNVGAIGFAAFALRGKAPAPCQK